MKMILTTLNSKYIHPNMALRLLKRSLDQNNVQTDLKEFTIKDDITKIIQKLIDYDVVAISCYIWNIEKIKEITLKLKQLNPNIIIIIGGPEVSYSNNQEITYDYLIRGEGEQAIVSLMNTLINNQPLNTAMIATKQLDLNMINKADLDYLYQLESVYTLDLDYQNQIVYFEASRGCPFQCSYCLSSLDNEVRLFNLDYVYKQLDIVLKHSKTIKFLDRTFNTNEGWMIDILTYIDKHSKADQVFQFEINADIISESLIAFLKTIDSSKIRFEIGIQSLNLEVNRHVRRYPNFKSLKQNIAILNELGFVLHLDLIAGLLYETLDSFIETFDEVFSFKGQELQLGFLKVLKGTILENNPDLFYDHKAPYSCFKTSWMSEHDFERIHQVEHVLEKYYNSNKARLVIDALISKGYTPFALFEKIATMIDINQLNLQVYDLYQVLYDFIRANHPDLMAVVYENYYANFKIKPKKLGSYVEKKIILNALDDHEYLSKFKPNEHHKYCLVEQISESNYFICDYLAGFSFVTFQYVHNKDA